MTAPKYSALIARLDCYLITHPGIEAPASEVKAVNTSTLQPISGNTLSHSL